MFAFTDEQKMVRQMVRKWVEAKLVPANEKLDTNELLPYELMRDFGKTFGLPDMVRASFERAAARGDARAPKEEKEEGGSMLGGGDPALQAILAIELSRVNPGFFMAFGAWLGLAGGAIMAKGTPAQKRRWALPMLTMEKIGAWGMTEPGAGSDAFGSMRTVARPDGDDYILNGQKTFITNAPFADTCVVYAKIDRGQDVPLAQRPIHAFIVEKGTPGFTQPAPMRKMGMHASPTGELFLADVRVPKANLLGEAEHETARDKAKDVFHGERTGIAPDDAGDRREVPGGGHGLQPDARHLGEADRRVPAHPGEAGAHVRGATEHREPALQAALAAEDRIQHECGRGVGDQAVLRARRHRRGHGGRPDPGGQRLHARVPRGAAGARRQAPADRWRDRRDPDHQHRAASPQNHVI